MPTVTPTPIVTLRRALAADKSSMLTIMQPHQNAHFPNGLNSKHVRIAEIDHVAVGFVGWKENRVLALYVAEEWRGHRLVGTALLVAAEQAISSAGYREVRVMIDADADRAHRFYQKAEYVTEPTDHDADVAWMTKQLG